jgi:hypothetical protein
VVEAFWLKWSNSQLEQPPLASILSRKPLNKNEITLPDLFIKECVVSPLREYDHGICCMDSPLVEFGRLFGENIRLSPNHVCVSFLDAICNKTRDLCEKD